MADEENKVDEENKAAEHSPMSLHGLAAKWDEDKDLRHQCVREKSLLKWQDAKRQGCINMVTLQLNAQLINALVELWCPRSEKMKTVCLEEVKGEVGGCKALLLHGFKV